MIHLLTLATSPLISVPYGYYTLQELSTAVSPQGYKLEVRPNCAEEMYAVRLSSVRPEAFADALRSTGRLTVEPLSGGWRVGRSEVDRDEDRTTVDRYLRATVGEAAQAFAVAAGKSAALLKVSAEEAFRESETLRQEADKRQPDARIASLVSSCVGYRKLPYSLLTLTPRVVAGGRFTVGRYQSFSVPNNRDLFIVPNQQQVLMPFTPSRIMDEPFDLALVKVSLDPATGTSSSMIVYGHEGDRYGMFFQQRADLRLPYTPLPALENILTKAEAVRYQSRVRVTQGLHQSTRNASGNTAKTASRFSQRLLNAAENAKQNLLAYVSPIADRVLAPGGEVSVTASVESANLGDFDRGSEDLSMVERTLPYPHPPTKSVPWRAYTVSNPGDVWVVRTESDFLDLLVEGGAGLPASLENRNLKGQLPTMTEVANHVSGLKISAWNSSCFSSRYLSYTNPTTLYPFARALVESPDFAQKVSALGADGTLKIPFSELDAKARKALEAGIVAVALKCETSEEGGINDPLRVAYRTRKGQLGQEGRTVVSVSRKEGRYLFAIEANQLFYWKAWMQGISTPEGR